MSKRLLSLLFLGVVSSLGACGGEVDDRPATFDYIATTILAPSCGTPACHSSLTKTAGLAFDTVDAARKSMSSGERGRLVVGGAPESSELMEVLTGDGERMPPDGPIPDKDIDLIETWILNGAEVN